MSRTVRMLVGVGVIRWTFVALAAVVAALAVSHAGPAYATTTFTVNSTGDARDFTVEDGKCFTGSFRSGVEVCTLRAAIEQANATNGADEIDFGILTFSDGNCNSLTGVCTIAPASGLPAIEDPVTIDGYTQPGAKENTPGEGLQRGPEDRVERDSCVDGGHQRCAGDLHLRRHGAGAHHQPLGQS